MKRKQSLVVMLILLSALFQACYVNEATIPAEDDKTGGITGPLHVKGDYFFDMMGRIVILRGVNVAGNSKVPPFMPILAAEMLDLLPAWGINVLRLLFTWEAFEPVSGQYNQEYLEYYEQVVTWAAERDIYVIVDFHQDAYSRFSIDGCGEGFPEWAVTPEVAHHTPDNGEACSGWGMKMIFDLSHHKTWEHFHNDKYGAQTAYLDMVEIVAERMSRHINVIGYELINEPWGTDSELSALYEKVGARIRSRHQSAILFIPPHAIVSGGMSDNNIPRPSFTNIVYSPHYYDGILILFHNWLGTSPEGILEKMRGKAVDWQVPMFLGEFGGPPDAGNIEGYVKAHYDWMDKRLVSGAQWCYTPGWRDDIKDGWNMEDFSIVDDSGAVRKNFTPRPYPQKIAGTPGAFACNGDGFSFSWVNDPAGGNTEIYVPAGYADDKEMSITLPEGVQGTCGAQGFLLICTIDGPGPVTLTLSRTAGAGGGVSFLPYSIISR